MAITTVMKLDYNFGPRLGALAICILLGAGSALAQTGAVEGRVLERNTENGLPGVNVGLAGTTTGTATDRDGWFRLTGLRPGTYTLIVSSIGFETVRLPVQVQAGDVTTLEVTLEQTDLELQEVEVVGRRATTYDAEYSFAATKVATPIVDVPQSISVVTKEVIDDQQLYTLNEVTRNVSGVNTFSGYNDLVTRGFRNQNTRLVNGLKTVFGFWSSPILPHIER
ncbi:MAG: carboxypeptidase-like regulatory domain-containing protein, partial [Bacteroidota bacterium]